MSSRHASKILTTLARPRIALRPLLHAPHTSPMPKRSPPSFAASRSYALVPTPGPPSGHHRPEPALTPVTRAIVGTTRFVRNTLLVSTTGIALGFLVWSGAHAYLEEYKCPSPAGVSKEVRNCLHGAWVREEVAADPDVAELYFQKAIELLRQDLDTRLRQRIQNGADPVAAELEMEKDKALVEIYHRQARFYGRTGRDEQAATIWTRLWKLSQKEIPASSSSSSPQSSATPSASSFSGLGSLFGAGDAGDRPQITTQDGITFAKGAANCWMQLGEYDLAEEALGWTLSTIKANPTTATASSSSSIDEIGLLSKLGALYVYRGNFDYALSLFVKALQMVQDHRSNSTLPIATSNSSTAKDKEQAQEDDMWYCREAILKHSIGETLYGAVTAGVARVGSADQTKSSSSSSSSSWKFWSSSSSSSSSSGSGTAAVSSKSPEQQQKEQEAISWMQQALEMANEKSGQHRDCDECAGLALNNLGLIYEMEGKKDTALQQFQQAVHHATLANDYAGLEDYTRNLTRLKEDTISSSVSIPPSSSSAPPA